MSEIVKISIQTPFAKGGNRACYVDPRNPSRCIKVLLAGKTAQLKRAQATWFKRLRPLEYYDDNLREFQSYRRIEANREETVWSHLPRNYGLVETDLGTGIVTELIRNDDQTISSCLKAKLRDTGNDQLFRDAVRDFCMYMRETALPTRDLLLHNLVAKNQASVGFKIYLIDGFGTADVLPYAYWFRSLALKKVERKIIKLQGKIDDFCQKYNIPYYE